MKTILRKLVSGWLINSSRVHLRRCNEEFAKRVTEKMSVLDAGAGTAPYRYLFEHANYETADFEMGDKEYFPSTYVCDLASIPVEESRFDHVVFNQVMEHLPDPLSVLKELRRVLKPGGTLICTCPLFYEEHEIPYDFYRYTQFAHRYLFEQAGLEIESLEWLEGYFGTIGYQLESIYRYLPVNPARFSAGLLGWLIAPILLVFKISAFALAGVFYRMDLRCKYTAAGWPKNYTVIARRPT